ncbi:MAG: hypothetical protein JWM77_625 [Rhodospirillales bacterium]|nr:hypothetical protein [Rhodospirillales bacterium]
MTSSGRAHEESVVARLRAALESDYLVLHDVATDDDPFARQIDVLVLHPARGMAVIECKASRWRVQDGRTQVFHRGADAWMESGDPLAQSKRALHRLWARLQDDREFALLRDAGLFLPLQHGVAMLEMDGADALDFARMSGAPDRFLFGDEPNPATWLATLLPGRAARPVPPPLQRWIHCTLARVAPRIDAPPRATAPFIGTAREFRRALRRAPRWRRMLGRIAGHLAVLGSEPRRP